MPSVPVQQQLGLGGRGDEGLSAEWKGETGPVFGQSPVGEVDRVVEKVLSVLHAVAQRIMEKLTDAAVGYVPAENRRWY